MHSNWRSSLTTFAFEKWHLFFYGNVIGASKWHAGLGFAASVATRWFVEKRGLVLGILAASWAAGQIMRPIYSMDRF